MLRRVICSSSSSSSPTMKVVRKTGLRRNVLTVAHHHRHHPHPHATTRIRASPLSTWTTQQQQSTQFTHSRSYSSTTPCHFAWWNPFSRGGNKSTTYVSSGKTTTTQDGENPRKVLERKDAILISLALEFRQLSIENPELSREEIIDMAFQHLEEDELDNKTQMQLRRYVQKAIDPQLVELLQTFKIVDDSFFPTTTLTEPEVCGNDITEDSKETLFDDDINYNTMYDQMLELELERTIDALADPNPQKAEKGPSPKPFLELKRSAIETLLVKRNSSPNESQEEYEADTEEGTTSEKEQDSKNRDDANDEKDRRITWVDADQFGYHESQVDEERNRLIRHYQTINICRNAKMRDEWGFSVIALKSGIAGAGRGVYVDGYAKAGSILCFQPGQVWAREHMMNLTIDDQRLLQNNDNYQMSLRYDDYMIDSRKSPYTVLTEENSNLMALGHIINHPTPSNPPNCRSIMCNFTQELELDKLGVDKYIPNTYAKPRNLSLVGTLMSGGQGDAVDIMHSMVVIATRDICNEELFYDYRLLTPQRPQWYHVVEETNFIETTDGDANEDKKDDEDDGGKQDATSSEEAEKDEPSRN